MAKPIVTQVKATQPTTLAEMKAELEKLKTENQALKSAQATADGYRFIVNDRSFLLKISQKQALSIYGLGRFPFTVYKEQAKDLFDHATVGHINQFLADNAELLADKPEKDSAKAE